MHKLLEVNWWKLILWIFAILTFLFGIVVAVVTDVIKEYLKPVVIKVFGRLHLINKPHRRASTATTNDQPPLNKKGQQGPKRRNVSRKRAKEEHSDSKKQNKRD